MTVLRVSRWRYVVAPEQAWHNTHERQQASAVRRKEGFNSLGCGVLRRLSPSRLADAFNDIRSTVFLIPIPNIQIPLRAHLIFPSCCDEQPKQVMEEHKTTVAALASQVKDFSANKTPFRIYHGSTLSTRHSPRQRNQIVDVSSLNHVLKFNKLDRTVLVEPNVPMDQLVDATLAEGLLPKVVMELPNITVGGG